MQQMFHSQSLYTLDVYTPLPHNHQSHTSNARRLFEIIKHICMNVKISQMNQPQLHNHKCVLGFNFKHPPTQMYPLNLEP
jgi:hypothetical protein